MVEHAIELARRKGLEPASPSDLRSRILRPTVLSTTVR
jgi:hypothetical protein